MKITKLGHCCLVIEDSGVKILTDPGAYSKAQNQITGIDIILITHEHPDHFHLESLRVVLKNNPASKIFTNSGVGALLQKEKIPFILLEDGRRSTEHTILLEGISQKHAVIYPGFGDVINTGYFIQNRFFYPGDAFTDPQKPVEILALPVSGPWMKISEAIDYAKIIKPKIAFPVHDGMLKFSGPNHRVPQLFLEPLGIRFIMPEGKTVLDFA